MILRRLSLMLLLFALAPGIAGAQTKISGCTTISAPGPYELSKNIAATASDLQPIPGTGTTACILVAADFVALDLAGYTITGPSSGNNIGISTDVSTRKGIEVRSGAVTKFSDGIFLQGSGHTVKHVRAIGNADFGIDVEATGSRIVGNTANDNGLVGIKVLCPAVVLENLAVGNTDMQIDEDTTAGVCTSLENNPAP